MMTALMKSLNVKDVEDPAPRIERRSIDDDGKQFAIVDSEDE